MAYHTVISVAFGLASLVLFVLLINRLARPRTNAWWVCVATLGGLETLSFTFLYRLAFHPFAQYPGPCLAACTDLWTVYWIIDGGRHLELHRQHQRHGKFVRNGPNRISIASATASRELHHVKANTRLADTYGSCKHFFGTETSMTTLDDTLHNFRRGINTPALTSAALKRLSGLIEPHVNRLVHVIQTGLRDHEPVDCKGKSNRWGPLQDMEVLFKYCIADIMADMTLCHGSVWHLPGTRECPTQLRSLW
ncbi:hypothetical protein F4780DRAFT_374532 [Xylariomycetidae sp. FL0641]|nr:hypothetical protein F4780DRAFT_374532 [Xylariomycetidae sp. FL0641]